MPKTIGSVADLKAGTMTHGFAPVQALHLGQGRIYGGATLFDGPVPACIELTGNPNGTVTAKLHGDAADRVASGGNTFYEGGSRGSRPRPEFGPHLQEIVAAFGSGERRLEVVEPVSTSERQVS